MKKIILPSLLTLSVLVSGVAHAVQTSYILPYKQENRWVAKEDSKDLRQLVKDAKKEKHYTFHVALPEKDRDVSIERLVILRNILEQSLKHGVVIEEIDAPAQSGHIIVTFSNP